MSNSPGPDTPPLGQPIPIERDQRDDGDEAPAREGEHSGNHTVVTPQTAGSAGAAHTEEG